MDKLIENLKNLGEKLPKKHGDWYRLKIYDNIYLLLDTWNGKIYYHKGCIGHDLNNLYRVIYTFTGFQDVVDKNMANFWNCHISQIKK